MAQASTGELGRLLTCCKRLLLALLVCAIAACVSSPSGMFDHRASKLEFQRTDITTGDFDLAVFQNTKPSDGSIRVYLEGDGMPFVQGRYPTQDPTSQQSVILTLMGLDPNASLLLGRPCYHQGIGARNCDDHQWWTNRRYSPKIVESMREALSALNPDKRPIKLFGFSGGGSLAVLLADEIQKLGFDVTQITTINANLDIAAWAAQQGFTPLSGSINPITKLDSIRNIKQLHFIGMKDRSVDPSPWLGQLEEMTNIEIRRFPNNAHHCCWENAWAELMLESGNEKPRPIKQ